MTTSKLTTLLLFTVAACDSQVDGDHQGQILAKLEGDMFTSTARTTTTAEVALNWVIGSGGTSFVGADKVQVEGTLPSHFSLSVFNLPSDDVLSDWDGIKFGAAYISAGPVGEDPENWQAWYGAELQHVLVYVPVQPPAGSAVAGLLHGTPTAGFHIYNARRLSEAERQQRLDCVTQASQGLGRMITRAEIFNLCGGDSNDELTLAPDDLDTQLSIEVVEKFGLPEFNLLPRWSGL